MSTTLGIWSQVLTPGKEEIVMPPVDIRITNIALGEELKDPNGRTVVKLQYNISSGDSDDEDDEEEEEDEPLPPVSTVLCSLIGGKIEQTTVDITLDKDMQYTFSLAGKNTVHLAGNYIEQAAESNFGGYDSPPSDDEDAYDLRDVSSDVEMNPADIDGLDSDASRFEEIDEQPKKTQKRPLETDKDEVSKESKKANKKLKAEGGSAVVAEPEDKKQGATKEKEKKEDEKVESKKKDKKKKKKEAGELKEKEKPAATEKVLQGGIKIKDSKIGTGPMAKHGNTLYLRYIGRLQDGKIFDQNTKGKPFSFPLGKGEVIKGWDEGLVGMQVGGERKLTIPPQMAYGKKGNDGIPGNATLTFEVKLLEIK